VPPPAPIPSFARFDDPTSLARYESSIGLLPLEVRQGLERFTQDPPETGALLLQNLPVGPLPPTPGSPQDHAEKDRVTETLLLTLASALGFPVGYLPEHGGDLVQNIVPVKGAADRQVSTSSKVRLEFHTEAAFHPHRPRYLLLFCLRGDPKASTTLSSVRTAVSHLDAATLDVLRQPRFATGVDESYLGYRSAALGDPFSPVSGPVGRETICFDGDLMQGLDLAAEAALESMRAAVDEAQIAITLAAGDLLVVDNRIAVHGRSPFTPRFDGTDRWLQRSFVVEDLSAVGPDLKGRTISTRFDSTRFGI